MEYDHLFEIETERREALDQEFYTAKLLGQSAPKVAKSGEGEAVLELLTHFHTAFTNESTILIRITRK